MAAAGQIAAVLEIELMAAIRSIAEAPDPAHTGKLAAIDPSRIAVAPLYFDELIRYDSFRWRSLPVEAAYAAACHHCWRLNVRIVLGSFPAPNRLGC